MTEHSASGERLLSSLIDHFDRRGDAVIRGSITLRLQPRALEFLASRLQVLTELEALKHNSPVEFFRGAFTNLEDYSRLQKLQRTLQQASSVRIQPCGNHLRDPTRVNLSPFQNLAQLELVGCDLSTTAWIGLSNVESIQCLKCTGCLEELQHLLLPFSHLLSPSGDRARSLWPQLTSLQCTRNTFERIDSSLNLPALRELDLSNNNILAIENLHLCTNLTSLNLSYNNIESLAPLRECTTTLQKLILQGNAARSIKGLQHLIALTELDLRCNLMASYQEFYFFKEMTGLRNLSLDGNPLSYGPFYRLDVLAWFDAAQICLDGVRPKRSECLAVAMRATGEVPLAWQIMAQYVSQQQLLWRPKEVVPPRIGQLLRTGSLSRQPSKVSPLRASPLRRHSMQRRVVPARRIVDFTGDPTAALQAALERPPSPSPFVPSREDSTDSISRASSASGARLPMLRLKDNLTQATVHTIYRERTGDGSLPTHRTSDVSLPTTARSKLGQYEAIEHPIDAADVASDSDSSSVETASSAEHSVAASPWKASSRERLKDAASHQE